MRIEPKQPQNAESKLQRFRAQIRKNSIKSRIYQQRRNLVNINDFEDIKSILKNIDTLGFPKNADEDKQDVNTSELIHLLEILQQQSEEASFCLQAEKEQLGIGFSNIFLLYSKRIHLEDKKKLLSTLCFLTYYSGESSKVLTQQQNFIDFLRTEIAGLEMKETIDIKYCKMIVILFMNLASEEKDEFNLYLAESDICKSINEQIYKTLNIQKHKNDDEYSEEVFQLRKCALKLFRNIIMNFQKKSVEVAVKLISTVVRDEIYFVQHPEYMFMLLQQAMIIEQFWPTILNCNVGLLLEQYITQAAQAIQCRCEKQYFLKNEQQTLTPKQQELFYALLLFLNQLNLQDESSEKVVFDWERFVQNYLNGFMLAEFIKIAHKNNNKKQMTAALTTYCHLSRADFVTSQQLLIVKPIEDKYGLLKIFVNSSWTASAEVGSYCWQILRNLLVKDKQYHKQLMELLIIERMENVLDNKFSNPAVLVELILFARQLVMAFEDVHKILQIFDNKNIINKIQDLTSHNSRQIFQKAEMFLEIVAHKKPKNSV